MMTAHEKVATAISDYATLSISVCALLFTVGSFWWIHARKGKMLMLPVDTFGGYVGQRGITLRLPILIRNTGAKPRIVRLLRLVAVDGNLVPLTLEAQTFSRSLNPRSGADDTKDMVHAYVVEGRGVDSRFIAFQSSDLPRLAPGAPINFRVEGKLDTQEKWLTLGHTKVHVGIMTGSYITWSNHQGHWRENTEAEGHAYQVELMRAAFGSSKTELDEASTLHSN